MPSLRTNGADPQQNTHTARPILEERRELGHTHTARAGLEEERRELVLQESRELGHAFAEDGAVHPWHTTLTHTHTAQPSF